jgi:hypothetical protein
MPPPLFVSPNLFVAEQFRFMRFNGQHMTPVSDWAKPGYQLCAAAGDLRVTMPTADLSLVSSTKGWFSLASGTGDQWFNFLRCDLVEPWKSNFNNFGHGVGALPPVNAPASLYLGPPPGPVYPPLAQVGARLYRYFPEHGAWSILTPTVAGQTAETYAQTCQRIADVAAVAPSAQLFVELLLNDGSGWKVNRKQVLKSFLAKDGAPFCVPTAQVRGQVGLTFDVPILQKEPWAFEVWNGPGIPPTFGGSHWVKRGTVWLSTIPEAVPAPGATWVGEKIKVQCAFARLLGLSSRDWYRLVGEGGSGLHVVSPAASVAKLYDLCVPKLQAVPSERHPGWDGGGWY